MSEQTGHAELRDARQTRVFSGPRAPNEAEVRQKQQAKQLMHADRQSLLLSSPFLGLLAMRIDLVAVVDSRVPTALTDGRTIFAAADFYLGLSERERVFLIGHEIWHCALQHFARRVGREQERWNIAVDHEVNDLLKAEGLTPPKGAVHEPSWKGLNAEQVYEKLNQSVSQSIKRGAQADLHEIPGAAPKAQVQDPDFAPCSANQVWRRWTEWVQAAAQQMELSAIGTLPGWVRERVQANSRPQIPWQRYLSRFIQQVRGAGSQWVPPSRRHWGRGLYLPSRKSSCLDIVVAVDTSGSTHAYWSRFRAELTGIMATAQNYRLRLLQHDTRVVQDNIYTPERPLPRHLEVAGGGGTDLKAPFEYLAAEQPVALLMLTDGCGPVPGKEPAYPVLWVLVGRQRPRGRRGVPEWGQVIQME
ncbi:DUF2201 family putative metallopeptidase [Halorhodospira halochloris]|uniref:vWA domain-containing protein n=1 Tax=Halorhodospira halochloris TaxID=1052 RepID=UPI001EE91CEB|nr:VWA-like domain-containing protein [Halorhodospira halochloris]MCG5549221.1 VWA-like domain-containing protein [Halorhodospira halochloris]